MSSLKNCHYIGAFEDDCTVAGHLPAAPLFELLERVCTLYSLPNWHDCVSISMLLASFGASYAKQCGNYLFLLIFGTLSSILHT